MNRLTKLATLAATAVGALALLALPSAAAARDRNHDHIPDRWEKRHHLSLKVNQARRDQDHDHLRNRAEFLAGDNPRNPDTNGNGIPDGEENAGKIQSFDATTGELTIEVFGGKTISGLVTEETEIECGGHQEGSDASASDSGQGGEEGGGDNGDRHGEEAGEAQDEEQGDDQQSGSEEPSDDDRGQGPRSPEEGTCTSADLEAGDVVSEAELKIESAGPMFEKVDLAG